MSIGPPVDPDLLAPLATSGTTWSVTPETIARRRARPAPTLADALAGRELPHAEHTADDVVLSVFGSGEASPVVLYVHGGGMFTGNRFSGVGRILDRVVDLDVVVVSIEYRLAPENPFPAAADDCWSALRWIAGGNLPGTDPARLVVIGSSAGGGLAAGLAQRARDEGGPAIAGQMLLSPMLDDRDATVSSAQYEYDVPWTRESNRTGWSALLGSPRPAEVSPYAAPSRASSLAGLPTTYLEVGSAEVFRDEDVDYASRLWADGVQAELHVWPGLVHGWDALAPEHPLAVAARRAQRAWLERTLGDTA